MYTDEEFFSQAIDLDIKGYILKESTAEDLIVALKSVSNGGSYISPSLADHVMKLDREKRSLVKAKPSVQKLTPTERQILKYLAENKTSKQIGDNLLISYKTVENHRANIRDKLNLKGLNALLKFAIENKSKL
jgi:DNA-binding NarL/FixJ family response regulator